MKEIILHLSNGRTLHCGEGENHQWGGYVRVCDERGNELYYWSVEEWAEDPECVMGAIFAAAEREVTK